MIFFPGKQDIHTDSLAAKKVKSLLTHKPQSISLWLVIFIFQLPERFYQKNLKPQSVVSTWRVYCDMNKNCIKTLSWYWALLKLKAHVQHHCKIWNIAHSQARERKTMSESGKSDQQDRENLRTVISFFAFGTLIYNGFSLFITAAQDILAGTYIQSSVVLIACMLPNFVFTLICTLFCAENFILCSVYHAWLGITRWSTNSCSSRTSLLKINRLRNSFSGLQHAWDDSFGFTFFLSWSRLDCLFRWNRSRLCDNTLLLHR